MTTSLTTALVAVTMLLCACPAAQGPDATFPDGTGTPTGTTDLPRPPAPWAAFTLEESSVTCRDGLAGVCDRTSLVRPDGMIDRIEHHRDDPAHAADGVSKSRIPVPAWTELRGLLEDSNFLPSLRRGFACTGSAASPLTFFYEPHEADVYGQDATSCADDATTPPLPANRVITLVRGP